MEVERVELLNGVEDGHGGVVVNMDFHGPMDSMLFSSMLKASIVNWRQQGKKAVWIKLSIHHSNLVNSAVKSGFSFYLAEANCWTLVHWISATPNTIPEEVFHRIFCRALVVNKKEVLVLQETSGEFGGTGVWEMPTGAVNEGEDICDTAVRVVKEQTGIETKFAEVLAFRQSHKPFVDKSALFFVCLLQPQSFDIQNQASEIHAAQWMSFKDYAAQPSMQNNELFDFTNRICSAKLATNYTGFSKLWRGFNNREASHLLALASGQVVNLFLQ